MSKIIDGHNKKVTSKPHDQRPKCNCRKKVECPMEGGWQVSDVVCKCDVTSFSTSITICISQGNYIFNLYYLIYNLYHIYYICNIYLTYIIYIYIII